LAGKAAPRSEPNRSSLKTRLDILEAVRDEGPSNRFKITTMANLSAERSVRYLEELVSLGLLMENPERAPRSYALTAKGLDFLNRVKEVEAIVAAYGLVL
jgi:predicted transcriptional regulator